MIFGCFFLAATDFAKTPEVDADAGETQLGFPQKWLNILMMFLDAFTINSKLQDSVKPALRSPPNLKISLVVCASGVNFRTV